jgi:hypothetical protein
MARPALVNRGLGHVPEPDEIRVGEDGKLSPQSVEKLRGQVRALVQQFNGRISLGSGEQSTLAGNLDAQYRQVLTPAVADTEFTVHHSLDRLITGYDVVMQDKPGSVYISRQGSWTEDRIYLKINNTSVTLNLRLF